MVAYNSALLAAANLIVLAQAVPLAIDLPVCSVVTTVITGSPIWVPRAGATTSAGWGAWPPKDSTTSVKPTTRWSTSLSDLPTTKWSTTTSWSTTSPLSTTPSTTTPSTVPITTTTPSTIPVITTTPSTTTASPIPTCDAVAKNVFSAVASGSCGCDFSVSCNMHAPYGPDTKFWERNSGEIIGSLAACQAICNDNSACTAAIWVNRDGAPSSEYMRCWQTSGLPSPDSDGYGQLSYKGNCAGSCSSNYNS